MHYKVTQETMSSMIAVVNGLLTQQPLTVLQIHDILTKFKKSEQVTETEEPARPTVSKGNRAEHEAKKAKTKVKKNAKK